MPARLEHITLATSDFATSLGFYDAALGALGLQRVDELVDEEQDEPELEAVAWGPASGPAFLWLVTDTSATVGVHVQLRADARDHVDAFHAAAIAAGGREHSAPRRWTIYRRGEYAAGVRDPQGNLVEVVAAE